jgi:hypothetical protein
MLIRVNQNPSMKKALKLSISKALSGGGHRKNLSLYPLQLLRYSDPHFRQTHTRTQL